MIIVKEYNSYICIKQLLTLTPEELLNKEFKTLVLNKEIETDDDLKLDFENLEVFIHLQHSSNNAFGVTSVLSDLQPEYIIIYEMDLECIRQIESYQVRRPNVYCRVNTITYKQSIDEQQYLTTSKREISAFEYIIENKDTMVKDMDREEVDGSDYSQGYNNLSFMI